MSTTDDSTRSKAIRSGIGIGVGIGVGWGMVMTQIMGGETTTGLTIGAGTGLVIALISGAAVYPTVTTD